MSLDVEMLIARLGWPIAATRWWTMQELASLLVSSESSDEISKRLLTELSRCRLEAEVVEIISVFWMAAKQGYTPPACLGSAPSHPSLLAARLLHEMDLGLHGGPNPPLETAPKGFVESAGFRRVQGSEVPRAYLSCLTHLERKTGLPFVKQCAFEWANTETAYPNAPLQGDLAYFVRPVGDGTTGSFACRAMLRMTTAYQRTLEVARALWGVPEELVLAWARDAFPLDPTLAFLRSERPSWLDCLGESVAADAASVERFIRRSCESLSVAQSDATLLALVSPTHVSDREIVELSVVRWRQWGATAVDARELAARFYDKQERWGFGACQTPPRGLATFVPIASREDVLDPETGAAPMAVVYGFDRFGYLQKHLYRSRLYYPVSTSNDDGPLTVQPNGSKLEVAAANGPVATLSYWNAGWHPVHPAAMGGFCGTALVGTADDLQEPTEPPPDRHFYLWRVTRFSRPNGYGQFEPNEAECGVVLQ